MRPLSALDAISPAWNHTSTLLLKPRSWRLLLKIGAVAMFAGLGGGGCNTALPPGHSLSHLPAIAPFFSAVWIVGLVAVTLISIAISLALLYLGSRLQFVLFEVMLTRRTTVAPIWAHYGAVTWRWVGFKFLFLLAALLCMAPVLVPAGIYLFKAIASSSNGSSPNLAVFVPAMVLSVGAIVLAVLVIVCIWTWLSDFGLPFIALEDTSITDTVRRVAALVHAEIGQSLLYLVLRVALAFACGLIAQIGVGLTALVALIPLGAAGGIFWMALHNGGLVSKAIMISAWVVLAIVFVVLIVCAAIIALGYVRSFIRTYSLYYLGGRFPRLGEYLDQYAAVAAIPTPQPQQYFPPYAPPQPGPIS